MDQAGEYSTWSGILLGRVGFYKNEAKWTHGYGRLSRANTHAMGPSISIDGAAVTEGSKKQSVGKAIGVICYYV